jgi:hypothetical protein
MRAGFGINELHIHPNLIACPSHAAFQYVLDTQFAANLFGVEGFVLVGKGCVAGDNKAAGNPREIGCQVVGYPVSEIFLLGIV